MNFNCKSGAFSHQSMCDNLPKRTLCSSSVLELMSLFALLTMIYIYICIYLLCANRALQILPPVKCLWQSRDRLQIHTNPQWNPCYSVALLPSVSPWLLLKISLANITLTQKFLIALTELPVLISFVCFFQSSTARQYSTQAGECFAPCESMCRWHLRRSEVWEWGQVGVQIDLRFDDIFGSDLGCVACFPEIRQQSRIVFTLLTLSASLHHSPVLQRWLCTAGALWCCVCTLS